MGLHPAKPPVDVLGSARTVLARKVPLRRAERRRDLALCAPFWLRSNRRRAAPAGWTSPLLFKGMTKDFAELTNTTADVLKSDAMAPNPTKKRCRADQSSRWKLINFNDYRPVRIFWRHNGR
jgi:hypothetical protein